MDEFEEKIHTLFEQSTGANTTNQGIMQMLKNEVLNQWQLNKAKQTEIDTLKKKLEEKEPNTKKITKP